ncbi:MAG: hypothetical protein AAF716_15495 [Cyanobacteria bacterium P01_D01_bin.1]
MPSNFTKLLLWTIAALGCGHLSFDLWSLSPAIAQPVDPEVISDIALEPQNERHCTDWVTDTEVPADDSPSGYPVMMWLDQMNHEHSDVTNIVRDPAAARAFVAEQMPIIESFPDDYSQSIGYARLGTILSLASLHDEAIELFERSAEKSRSGAPLDALTDHPDYIGIEELSYVIAVGFATSGDAQKGLTHIQETLSSPGQVEDKLYSLLKTARILADEENASVAIFMEEAERTARSLTDGRMALTDIAGEYVSRGDLDNAGRITEELLLTIDTKRESKHVSAEENDIHDSVLGSAVWVASSAQDILMVRSNLNGVE